MNTPQQTKRLILIGTDKGGVGKTFFTAALAEWIMNKHPKTRFALFDPDGGNRSLKSVFGVAHSLDVAIENTGQGADKIVQHLGPKGDADLAIVDAMGSNQSAAFLPWARSIELFGAGGVGEEYGFRTTIVLMVGQQAELVDQAGQMFDELGTDVDYLLVRIAWRDKTMPLWDNSQQRRKLVESGVAKEISFPGLFSHIVAQVWTTLRQPVVSNANAQDPMDARRVRTWAKEVWSGLDEAAGVLLPPATANGEGAPEEKKAAKK